MSTNWDNPTEMLTKAQTAHTQGDTDMAYQFYARASELSPQQVSAWQGRAETATSSDEALVSYAYASALDNHNEVLARTLDAALDQRVQSSNKADVPLLVALGQEFAEVGLGTRARTLLERASELDPSSTDALVWLAGTAPDEQSQLDYLNRALATNPRDPRARAGYLSVKLPTPATPVTAASETSTVPLDTLTARPPITPATTQPNADEAATMERLRKLRAQVPAESTSKTTPKKALAPPTDDMDALRATAVSNQTRMRNLMLLLLGGVVVLVILGIILLQLQ